MKQTDEISVMCMTKSNGDNAHDHQNAMVPAMVYTILPKTLRSFGSSHVVDFCLSVLRRPRRCRATLLQYRTRVSKELQVGSLGYIGRL